MQDPPANALFMSKSLRRDMIGTLIKYLPKYVLIVSQVVRCAYIHKVLDASHSRSWPFIPLPECVLDFSMYHLSQETQVDIINKTLVSCTLLCDTERGHSTSLLLFPRVYNLRLISTEHRTSLSWCCCARPSLIRLSRSHSGVGPILITLLCK